MRPPRALRPAASRLVLRPVRHHRVHRVHLRCRGGREGGGAGASAAAAPRRADFSRSTLTLVVKDRSFTVSELLM